MAHQVLDSATAYGITGGKVLDEATAYSIKQGRCMSDGTVYDISFQKPKIVTITGTPNSSYGYATINGTKLSEAGVYEFDGPLTISVMATNQYGISTGSTTVRRLCRVYLNGTAVSQQQNSTADKAYTMTSESEEVTIDFQKKSIYVSGYGTEYYWCAYITTS